MHHFELCSWLTHVYLLFQYIYRTKSTRVPLILYFFMVHQTSKMLAQFCKRGIPVSQLGMVLNMSPLFFSPMSSPKFQHLKCLQTLQRNCATSLDPRGMLPLPYSINTRRSTTRESGLDLLSHLTAGWPDFRLHSCVFYA